MVYYQQASVALTTALIKPWPKDRLYESMHYFHRAPLFGAARFALTPSCALLNGKLKGLVPGAHHLRNTIVPCAANIEIR